MYRKLDKKREKSENFPLSHYIYFLILLEHKNYAVQIFIHQFHSNSQIITWDLPFLSIKLLWIIFQKF